MRILLVGGGTGGHLYPLLAVAQALKASVKEEVELLYIGPTNHLSDKILKKNGIKTRRIFTSKWRRYQSIENFLDIFKFPLGLIQCLFHVLTFMPDVVFSKGGYGSVAPTIAARLYFIPILIHESDVVPGQANRLMAKICDRIAVSFPETQQNFKAKKVLFTGNPIRGDIRLGDHQKAFEFFKLSPAKPIILVLGGSQGSQLINKRIVSVLPRLLKSYQVIHQVGSGNLEKVKDQAGQLGIKIERSGYRAYEYLDNEIIHAFAVCTMVISRAGAGSITEIAAVQRPAILIPLEGSANAHQLNNAHSVARVGGAILLEEPNFKREILMGKIEAIMNDPDLRQRLSQGIGQFYQPQAATKIVQGLLYLARRISKTEGESLFKK